MEYARPVKPEAISIGTLQRARVRVSLRLRKETLTRRRSQGHWGAAFSYSIELSRSRHTQAGMPSHWDLEVEAPSASKIRPSNRDHTPHPIRQGTIDDCCPSKEEEHSRTDSSTFTCSADEDSRDQSSELTLIHRVDYSRHLVVCSCDWLF